ncbi:MAG: fibronectin type III domain-containing protein, partial [Acutalibacteraceae bacterium]
CTAMGKETATCSRCDYEKTRDIEKIPHTEITVSAVAPTCTKSGKTAGKKCSVCGTTTVAQETVPALGHNLGAYKVTKKATCTAMGKETATCSRCDYEKSRDIAKAPHSEVTVKAVAPTCTKSGKTAGKKCSVCGTTTVAQETVPALGHNLGAYKVTKKATCTAMGKETASCSRCDYEKSRDIARVPHNEVTVKAVAPTCTKSGKTAGKKCSVCGTTTVAQETVPALGHNLGAYKVTKKATCTAMGKETATCSRCDYEKSRDIARVPHNEVTVKAVAPTCTKSGKTAGKKCSVCGKITVEQETIPAKGHKTKTELTRATQTTNGKLRKTCSVCEAYISSQVIYKVTDFRMTSAYVYDGKVKTPLPVVRDEKGNTLKKDRDYVLTYSAGRKNIGQYAVKITLTGNYSSEKTLSFTVTPSKTAKISASPAASAIKLTWSKVKYATGYRVFVADSKTGKYKTVATTSENTLTIRDLSPGTAYKFAVRAYSKVGSKVIWGAEYTVIQCATKPLTPTLKVTGGKGSAELTWTKVACTGYQVYVSTEKDKGYQKIATVKGASTVKLSHKGLKSGQVYYFKIRAFKQLGDGYVYSPLSKAVAVTIK